MFPLNIFLHVFFACGDKVDASSVNPAFDDFSENVVSYIDGDEIVIETNGLPDHTSPYWSTDHELYVSPTVTSTSEMAPGLIDDFNGSYTLRVPVEPELASSSSSTGLGAIGIAVTGQGTSAMTVAISLCGYNSLTAASITVDAAGL